MRVIREGWVGKIRASFRRAKLRPNFSVCQIQGGGCDIDHAPGSKYPHKFRDRRWNAEGNRYMLSKREGPLDAGVNVHEKQQTGRHEHNRERG
jgi:hypothetical protein